MIQLREKQTGAPLGTITEEDLQFLIDNLVEESDDDTDYYLNRTTIDMLRQNGATDRLLKLLDNALGDKDDVEIEWERSG